MIGVDGGGIMGLGRGELKELLMYWKVVTMLWKILRVS
jgi:hypothetical protein